MGRGRPYALLALATAVPRLVVVFYERDDLVLDPRIADFNTVFARTFVASGTFGPAADVPSAYAQPLYGFFLVPLYWMFDGSWLSIGLAQTAIATGTAWLVYEVARRLLEPVWALLAAVVAAVHPYLVWHDVHTAREVLDGLLAAGAVLLTLLAAERRSVALAALLGAAAGLSILANVRLVLLPLVLAAFLLWKLPRGRGALVAAATLVGAAMLVVSPWVVRNRVQLGCFALTTNGEALWRANNAATYETLAAGKWIDDVPQTPPPGRTARPKGAELRPDECEQSRFYERRAVEFWRDHPGEKARLAGQATVGLWDPRSRRYDVRASTGEDLRPVPGAVDFARVWIEGMFMAAVYAFAVAGIGRVRRDFAVLALALLAYQTLAAMVFAGTTRYRVAWDFLLVVIAAAALAALAPGLRTAASNAGLVMARRRRRA